jgi:uncharacterized protein HemX
VPKEIDLCRARSLTVQDGSTMVRAKGDPSRNQSMSLPMRMKWLLAAAVIAGLAGSGVAFSQDQLKDQPKDQSQPAATTTEKVKAISKKEWDKMKGQWAKQKEKWADCNKQSTDQKLSGRKSWSFIASCMTS